ncbi:MAG: hypothetical protein QM493_07760 [Sulfurovum sp.]
MGNTLWILEEEQESDNWDHSEIIKNIKDLDTITTKLGFSKLISYFDESIWAKEFGMEIEAKYFDVYPIEKLILVLIDEVKKKSNNRFLIDEMEDILSKCILAKEKNVKIRLALVP